MLDIFEKGQELVRQGMHAQGAAYFQKLKAERPKCAKTRMLHAWAQYLDLRERVKAAGVVNDKRLKLLAKKYKTTIQKEQFRVPEFVLGYVFVGRIQLDEGTPRRAMVTFERALRQVPDHKAAQHWHKIAQRQLNPATPLPAVNASVLETAIV